MPSIAVTIRQARREDLPAVVELLHQDELYRSARVASAGVDPAVSSAFEVIASDPNILRRAPWRGRLPARAVAPPEGGLTRTRRGGERATLRAVISPHER